MSCVRVKREGEGRELNQPSACSAKKTEEDCPEYHYVKLDIDSLQEWFSCVCHYDRTFFAIDY